MDVQQIRDDIAEFEAALAAAKGRRLRTLLESHIAKMKGEIESLEREAQRKAAAAKQQEAAAEAAGQAFTEITRYSWTETEGAVKLYIALEGCGIVARDDVLLQCTDHSISLRVLRPRALAIELKPLKEAIDTNVAKHSIRFKDNEAVVTVAKAKNGKWYELLSKDRKVGAAGAAGGAAKDEDPGASLMNLMKQMYDDGDDETKRIIGKAWTESREKQMKGQMD